jgi:hypothetical protein
LFSAAVSLQMAFRGAKKKGNPAPPRRSTQAPPRRKPKKRQPKVPRPLGPTFGASIAQFIGANTSKVVRRLSDGIIVEGQEVVITGQAGTVSSWQLAGGHRFNPLFSTGTRLSRYAQLYEEFKFLDVMYQYFPSSASSSSGDVLITFEEDPTQPLRAPGSSQFVAACLSKPGALLTSIWRPAQGYCQLRTTESKYISLAEVTDLRDSCQGDLLIYTSGSTTTTGYVMIKYRISFTKEITTPVNTTIGSGGDWGYSTITIAANPTVATLVNGSINVTTATGQIYEFVCDATRSTFGTGTTAANAFYVTTPYTNSTGLTVADGTKFYLLAQGTGTVYVFPSLIAATAGIGTTNSGHFIGFQNQNTTTTSLVGFATLVKLGDLTLETPV